VYCHPDSIAEVSLEMGYGAVDIKMGNVPVVLKVKRVCDHAHCVLFIRLAVDSRI
jgi:hypothetical protein